MRLLVFVRTAIMFLIGFCACVAFSSSARRKEEPDTSSGSTMTDIIPKGERNQSVTPGKSDLHIPNNESRGGLAEQIVAETRKVLLQTSHQLGLEIPEPSLNRIMNIIERLGRVNGENEELPHVTKLIDEDKWLASMKAVDFPWEDSNVREVMFHQCLNSRKSPADIFEYMKVHLMYSSSDSRSIDPKLLWWLDYVKKYRNLNDVGTIAKAMSSTATSHELFDDEKLFTFLVDKDVEQTAGLNTLTAAVPLGMPLPDLRQPVVTLFELLRRVPTTKNLAEDMQQHLVRNAETLPLLLNAWLRYRVSPPTIFNFLRIGSELGRIGPRDNAMLIFWVTYVVRYWESLSTRFINVSFNYSSFLHFLRVKSSPECVEKVLHYISLRQMIEKESPVGFGNHAYHLLKMWDSWPRLCDGVTPQIFFHDLNPSGKFERGSVNFMKGLFYIELYRTIKPFTDQEFYNLLSQANSYIEIAALIQFLWKYWWLRALASGMINYLTRPSTVMNVAEMTPAKYWQIWLPKRDQFELTKDYPTLLNWSIYAELYCKRANKDSRESEILKIRKLVRENVPADQYVEALESIKQVPRVRKREGMSLQEEPPSQKKPKREI